MEVLFGLTGGNITKEVLNKASQTLKEYMSAKAKFDQRCVENEQWWKMRHWEEIPEKGTTSLETKSAWLVNVILSKHADAMDALPECSFLPREPGDQAEAEKLSSIMPVVMRQAGFREAWDKNWWKKLKVGTAIYGEYWDASALNGLGNIAVEAVDPLQLFWEPGIRHIQESRNVFHVVMRDNEQLEEEYPQLRGKLGANDVSLRRYQNEQQQKTGTQSAVIDWYYKRKTGGKTVLHYCKYVGETVLFSTERDETKERPALPAKQEPVPGEMADAGATDSSVAALPQNDMGFAERGLYDHGLYPFFLDVLFPEEGSITGYGYVDLCKDAQRQIDLMNNAIVANAIAAATPRWLTKVSEDGINEEEFIDWTKPIVHHQGSIDDTMLKQIVVNPLSGNYLGILQSKIDELKDTSGNRDVNNGGIAAGVTTASGIAALQEQSGKLSRDQIAASYRVTEEIDTVGVELVRQFFDAPRTFRILGANGQPEFTTFDNSGLQPVPQGIDFGEDMGMRQPEFDIEIVAAKQSAFSKISQNDFAIKIFQMGFFNPELADQALATIDMMDFKGKDEVRQRISQNGGMYQQILQLQAQIQQLMTLLGMPAPQLQAQQPMPQAAPQGLGSGGGGAAIVEKARERAAESTQPR